MQTQRLLTRHLRVSNHRFLNPTKLSKRYHVYDKRHHVVPFDDWASAGVRTTAWDFLSLHNSQPRHRRISQIIAWIGTYFLVSSVIKFHIHRKRATMEEKWDYQAKYWKEGYWIREFPEGLVAKEFKNGKVAIEPAFTPRLSLKERIFRTIFFVDGN